MSRMDFVVNSTSQKAAELVVKVINYSKKIDKEVLLFTDIVAKYIVKELKSKKQQQIFSYDRMVTDLTIPEGSRIQHIAMIIMEGLAREKIFMFIGHLGIRPCYIIPSGVRKDSYVKNHNILLNAINKIVYEGVNNEPRSYNSMRGEVREDEFYGEPLTRRALVDLEDYEINTNLTQDRLVQVFEQARLNALEAERQSAPARQAEVEQRATMYQQLMEVLEEGRRNER